MSVTESDKPFMRRASSSEGESTGSLSRRISMSDVDKQAALLKQQEIQRRIEEQVFLCAQLLPGSLFMCLIATK